MSPRLITGRLPGQVYSRSWGRFRLAASEGFSIRVAAPAHIKPGSLIGSTEILVSVQAPPNTLWDNVQRL